METITFSGFCWAFVCIVVLFLVASKAADWVQDFLTKQNEGWDDDDRRPDN